MNPVTDAVLRSWPLAPWLVAGLLLTGLVYLRGWRHLSHRDPRRWQRGQPLAFLSGLLAIFLALGSPLEPFAALSLTAHMAQHLLLMMAAPPLLWLGTPLIPLLRGLPRPVRVYWAAPLVRVLNPLVRRLTHPAVALPLFTAATWIWHIPHLYEMALRSRGWHEVQHLTFFSAGLLFWYPVVRPYPSRPSWPLWLLVPYLLLADVSNTALSALLTFSGTVLYPHYAEVPQLGAGTPLDDQAAAGVLMWVPGSLAFLLPLACIGGRLLFGLDDKSVQRGAAPFGSSGTDTNPVPPTSRRLALPLVTPLPPESGFDLLCVPLLGRFLKWRHARLTLQLPLLLIAVVIIHDGLTGPQPSPMNLAGVLPWVHWRGLVVLGLLVAGNVFCLACPFLVPRTLARRWLPAGRAWPRWLRGKWLAAALLLMFFWAYEALALWDSPWLTAWIAIGYFVAAFTIDGLFRGAAFCKYVCPIGQFNFVQSLASPLEVMAREPALCERCTTKDCIRGRDTIPGCELNLYLPRKKGNLDCTFCLDCVHACPHDNVAIGPTLPTSELWRDPSRSGVGRFGRRLDLAALVLVLVFAAFVNAAGMVAPVVRWQQEVGAALGLGPWGAVTLFYALALLVLPATLVVITSSLCRAWGALSDGWLRVATRFSYALVPLGFAMWLAHYGFHLATGYEAAVPAALRWATEEMPDWASDCCTPTPAWLLRAEILLLDLGLLLSLYASFRIAASLSPRPMRAAAPWALLILLLFVVGIWILFQPMQMRGTLAMVG